jgi:hypothetical protein
MTEYLRQEGAKGWGNFPEVGALTKPLNLPPPVS